MDTDPKDCKPPTFDEFEAFFQPLMDRTEDDYLLAESDGYTPLTINDLDRILGLINDH